MIDLIREDRLIKSMLSRMPEIDGSDAVILAVEPECSGILAQRVAHAISVPNYLPVVLSVDIPDDRTEESYMKLFGISATAFQARFHKIIICSTYTCPFLDKLKNTLFDLGYEYDDLVFVSMTEHWDSDFRANVVGEYVDKKPVFYWEKQYDKDTTDSEQ
jgi:hypothetical protein